MSNNEQLFVDNFLSVFESIIKRVNILVTHTMYEKFYDLKRGKSIYANKNKFNRLDLCSKMAFAHFRKSYFLLEIRIFIQ